MNFKEWGINYDFSVYCRIHRPKRKTTIDFDYSDEAYDLIGNDIIHSKRIRAKKGEQAIKIFQQKYPELEVIGWR